VEGGCGGQGREMAPKMYAHINKDIKKELGYCIPKALK
jgi:hypothetical protein